MYDPTYAHYITMALYEDRLRLVAADARTRPSSATAVLRGLLGRGESGASPGRRRAAHRGRAARDVLHTLARKHPEHARSLPPASGGAVAPHQRRESTPRPFCPAQ